GTKIPSPSSGRPPSRTSSRRSSGRGSRWSRSSPDPPCPEGKKGGLTVKLFKGHYTSARLFDKAKGGKRFGASGTRLRGA
ncbi:MAG: hypothetical protein ACREYE_24010, partial [Gammaproteobacteria bacterium]